MDGAVYPSAALTLEDLARKIEHHGREGHRLTLEAAMLLREARERVDRGEAGDVTWWQWAKKNVDLQASRLRLLLQIAQAEDPAAEYEEILAQGRKRTLEYRKRQSEIRAAKAAFEPERRALLRWVEAADIAAVTRVLHAIKSDSWHPFEAHLEAAGEPLPGLESLS